MNTCANRTLFFPILDTDDLLQFERKIRVLVVYIISCIIEFVSKRVIAWLNFEIPIGLPNKSRGKWMRGMNLIRIQFWQNLRNPRRLVILLNQEGFGFSFPSVLSPYPWHFGCIRWKWVQVRCSLHESVSCIPYFPNLSVPVKKVNSWSWWSGESVSVGLWKQGV